jgi:hypothetical protein
MGATASSKRWPAQGFITKDFLIGFTELVIMTLFRNMVKEIAEVIT